MSRTRTFNDPEQLEKLFTLRKNGVRILVLADMFQCDRTTIHWHLKRHGIVPDKPEGSYRKLNERKRDIVKVENAPLIDEYGDVVNEGRDYKDYLKDDLAKRQKEREAYLSKIGFTGK